MKRVTILDIPGDMARELRVRYSNQEIESMLSPEELKPMIVKHIAMTLAEEIMKKIDIKIGEQT
jgi:hypothetical protein